METKIDGPDFAKWVREVQSYSFRVLLSSVAALFLVATVPQAEASCLKQSAETLEQQVSDTGPIQVKGYAQARASMIAAGVPEEGVNRLFNQRIALASGKFDFSSPTVEAEFLKNYWTPAAGVEGVVVDASNLIVYVKPEKTTEAGAVLPRTIEGRAVVIQPLRIKPIKLSGSSKSPGFHAGKSVVLITGSGTGIGLAVAKKLISQGYRVIMTARESALSELRSQGFKDNASLMLRPLDVTRADQQSTLVAEINQKWGGVDVLVNNAAVVVQGAGEHITAEEMQKSLNTNFVGPASLSALVTPMMRFKGQGRIFNISSMTAEVPAPLMGAYSSSKAALNAYMTSLGAEVKPFGMKVSTFELGFIKSDAHEKIVLNALAEEGRKDPSNPYYRAYQTIANSMKLGRTLATATPEKMADRIADFVADANPPDYARLTPDARALNLLKRLLPTSLFNQFATKLLTSASKFEGWLKKLDLQADAQAPPPKTSMARVISAIRYLVDILTEDLSGRKVIPSKGISLKIGERLGFGLGGAVYTIDQIEGDPALTVVRQKWGPLVIKTAHFVRGTYKQVRAPQSIILQNRELSLYTTIKKQILAIEGAPSYPKHPNWAQGSMPVIPIVHSEGGSMGNLIFKPRVNGVSLEEIYARHKGEIPAEMVTSLRQIYDFSQAMFEASKLKDLHPALPIPSPRSRPLYIDLNPSNLIWIEDPVELKKLGMSQPGFMLFELGEFISPRYQSAKTSFEDFLNETKEFMKSESS